MNTDDIYKIVFIEPFEKISKGSEFKVKNSQVLYKSNNKDVMPKRWLEYVLEKGKAKAYIRVKANAKEDRRVAELKDESQLLRAV